MGTVLSSQTFQMGVHFEALNEPVQSVGPAFPVHKPALKLKSPTPLPSKTEMGKKYTVDFEAAARTSSSRASNEPPLDSLDPQSLNPFMASLWIGSGEVLVIKGFGNSGSRLSSGGSF